MISWFPGDNSEGCNEHTAQLTYSSQKCTDTVIDYKSGKFLINKHITSTTVCKASETVTVAAVLNKWDALREQCRYSRDS